MTDEPMEGPIQDLNVVIWTNEAGGVSVRRPAPGVVVDAAFLADCPVGAAIVAAADLPDADDVFDAWRLVDGTITVDMTAARAAYRMRLDATAQSVARVRSDLEGIGLTLAVSREAFLAGLASRRAAIAAASSVADLRAVDIGAIGTMGAPA